LSGEARATSDEAVAAAGSIPIPPPPMRQLVGPTDPEAFDNPNGDLVFPYLQPETYEAVFDFGCGCGRIARQLIQQRSRPGRYVGIDLHPAMIEWCNTNLRPFAPEFEFYHHDVFNYSFNPGPDKPTFLPFPVADAQFTLVNAWSVFTHLNEAAARHYLHEAARILKPTGILHATWFLFNKTDFPMMQEFQNALYINETDPTNAVIFDRAWVRNVAAEAGLTIYFVQPPSIRGFQWIVMMTPRREGVVEVDFPEDRAPAGIMRPPLIPEEYLRVP
jgi:SAM-dependent methyltransferase